MEVFDRSGRRFLLEGKGKAGGEGTIYRVTDQTSLAAKIFHNNRFTTEMKQKLQAMIAAPPKDASLDARKHRSIIWPLALAYEDPRGTTPIGYVMPWVDTSLFRESHTYYDPADRIRRFGGLYTWRHLMIAALNLSSAVAGVHAQGHRIGDLRDTNILIAPNSLVTLIDCDSFQVKDLSSGRVFPTRVGTGEFLPPEMQSADFRNVEHDRYHSDLFALAVLIFKLLMLGAHPYQARGGPADELPSTESKIAAGIYPYGGRTRGVAPPRFAPDIKVLPPRLQSLAHSTFVAGHKHPDHRPEAHEWFDALNAEGQRLKICQRNQQHVYGGHLRACPWCRMATDPFPPAVNIGGQIAATAPSGTTDINDRREHLRSYIEMALIDGAISSEEDAHIKRMGTTMGLRSQEIADLIKKEERKVASASTKMPSPPRPAARVAAPPRPKSGGRTIEELQRLLEEFENESGGKHLPGLEESAPPILLAGIMAAATAIAPIAGAAFVILLLVSGLASSAEVHADRMAGRSWSRIAPRILTRPMQNIVQSIYYLIPAITYSALPSAAIFFVVTKFMPVSKVDAFRYMAAAMTAAWLVWLLLLAPAAPFTRSLRDGTDLLFQPVTKRVAWQLSLPMIGVMVIGLLSLAIAKGALIWWPLQRAPFR